MPTSDGRFLGISVPRLPWQEDKPADSQQRLDAEATKRLNTQRNPPPEQPQK